MAEFLTEFLVTFFFILAALLITFVVGTGLIVGGFMLLKVYPPLAFVWWIVGIAAVLAFLEVKYGDSV